MYNKQKTSCMYKRGRKWNETSHLENAELIQGYTKQRGISEVDSLSSLIRQHRTSSNICWNSQPRPPPTFTMSSMLQWVIPSTCINHIVSEMLIVLSPSCRSFRNLSPKARIGVGIAFLAWGTLGLYISDNAEKKLGFEPTEKDRQALDAAVPKITVVERDVKG